MVETLSRLSQVGYTSYPVNHRLAFALSDERVVIITPLCSYILTSDRLNSKAGHERIRRGVLNNEYKSLADVLTDMRLIPGVGVGYRIFSIKELE